MFSYYGSKSKIVDYYPPPKHKRIIEPFAGSARYSLKYWENDVLLLDKYDIIVKVWNWLKQCSPNDILKLPEYEKGETIDKTLTDEERYFVAFMCNRGSSRPHNVAGSYHDVLPIWRNRKKVVANELYKIKHWEIRLGSYDELENIEATWFIDPPYQFGGEHYKESNKQIDFEKLGEWCKSRNGQVIVCENSKADWMPFVQMINMQGQKAKTTEVIWANHKTNYDNVQVSLF